MNLTQIVKLLGYRRDIPDLYSAVDFAVLASFIERLSVALMEAMVSGLPIIASSIRGNIDLIDVSDGLFFSPFDMNKCGKTIDGMFSADRLVMGIRNKTEIERFSLETVLRMMYEIYKNIYEI